ncbi:MAG: hypothetical protein WCJ86_02260 [Candidatus Saccharibacteria bacterium]|jgi:plastocyanin
MTKTKKQQLIYISIAVVILISGGLIIASLVNKPTKTSTVTSLKTADRREQTAYPVVDIFNSTFTEHEVHIKKGGLVAWGNFDKVSHTVTGDNGGPNSEEITTTHVYSYKFEKAGTFNYHCKLHPLETGVVIVSEN